MQLDSPRHYTLHCRPFHSLCRSNDLPLLCPVCKAGADPPCARCSLLKVAAGGGPAVQWCCRLDSDVVRLLDGNQMEEYLRKSLQVGRLVVCGGCKKQQSQAVLVVYSKGGLRLGDSKGGVRESMVPLWCSVPAATVQGMDK